MMDNAILCFDLIALVKTQDVSDHCNRCHSNGYLLNRAIVLAGFWLRMSLINFYGR